MIRHGKSTHIPRTWVLVICCPGERRGSGTFMLTILLCGHLTASSLSPDSTGKTPNVPRKPLSQSWRKNLCKCHFLPSKAGAALPILTSTTSKGLCFPRQIRFMQNKSMKSHACFQGHLYLRNCWGVGGEGGAAPRALTCSRKNPLSENGRA